MIEQQRAWHTFWLVNAIALLIALAGGVALFVVARQAGNLATCPFHDVLRLYCPVCGGTRATWHLLHGKIGAALRCHAAVVWTCAALLFVDIRAFFRLLRQKTRPFYCSPAFWWGLLAAFLLYALLRNVWLVAFRVDWVGDFIQ